MAFIHVPVAVAEAAHARLVQTRAHDVVTQDAETPRGYRIFNDLPVAVGLVNFCEAIRAQHRSVKFAIQPRPKTYHGNGVNFITEIWAYFPGDTYCSVRLGWGDYAVGANTGNKYSVYARHIDNEKFGADRDQRHMALSDSMDRAVKNFNKYLRPYKVSEIAAMSIEEFQSLLRKPLWEASNQFNEAYTAVIRHDSFNNEMRMLIDTGHTFVDPSFKEVLMGMLDKLDEHQNKQHETHHGYYVHVREYMGEPVFDVVPVLDIKKASAHRLGMNHVCTSAQLAEMDESLPNKLAALSMLDKGAFVEGLGHKVNDTSYWVLK